MKTALKLKETTLLKESLTEYSVRKFLELYAQYFEINGDGVVSSLTAPVESQIAFYWLGGDQIPLEDLYKFIYPIFTAELFSKIFDPYIFVISDKNLIGFRHDINPSGWRTLRLPNGIETINYSAFAGFDQFETIIVPEGVKEIKEGAFSNMHGLKYIQLPDSINTLGMDVFLGDSSLKGAILPTNLTTLPAGLFHNCKCLKDVTIGGAVTEIKDGAFYGCSSLDNVILPQSLTVLEDDVFYGCSSLTSLIIPPTIQEMGACFTGCASLKQIICDNEDIAHFIKMDLAGWDVDVICNGQKVCESLQESNDCGKTDGRETEIIENLTEKIEKHDTLNPKLWDEDGTLKEEVHDKIIQIAGEFIENLKEDGIQFDLKDIRIVGSNCSYNYTKDSDLDVHLIADSTSLNCPDDLYPLLYSSYRSIFNKNLDIDFYGIPVEIYVEVE